MQAGVGTLMGMPLAALAQAARGGVAGDRLTHTSARGT
jgi:hypothetical protein